MYKSKYNGSNAYTLITTFGKDADYILAGLDTTAGIRVVCENFSMPFATKESKNAYMPVGTITLRET